MIFSFTMKLILFYGIFVQIFLWVLLTCHHQFVGKNQNRTWRFNPWFGKRTKWASANTANTGVFTNLCRHQPMLQTVRHTWGIQSPIWCAGVNVCICPKLLDWEIFWKCHKKFFQYIFQRLFFHWLFKVYKKREKIIIICIVFLIINLFYILPK